MSNRLTEKERKARRNLREARDLLQNQIEAYQNTGEFSIKDAIAAIQHAYSIVARYELEYEAVPSDSYFEEIIEEIENSFYENPEEKTITIDKKVYDKLVKVVEREKSRIQRADLLKDMTKANRVLAQQVSENEKIRELQRKSEYIELAMHMQVLDAFVDVTYLALRKIGLDDKVISEFTHQLQHLKNNYPLIKASKEDVIKRLTKGEEPVVIEAQPKEVSYVRQTAYDLEKKAEELL